MIQGEYVLNTLFSLERVWNRYGTDTQLNITFQVFHSMVWNGGVWNGIRGLDPKLWIGVWIGMCARPFSGPFILSGSQVKLPSKSQALRILRLNCSVKGTLREHEERIKHPREA